MVRIFYAKDGFVWKSKKEGWIGSETLILGSNDSIDNYEEVEKPAEEPAKEGEQYGRRKKTHTDRGDTGYARAQPNHPEW